MTLGAAMPYAACSPLFREVVSVADGTVNGTKILSTTFATFSDIGGIDLVDESIRNDAVEPVSGCRHSIGIRQLMNTVTPLQDRISRGQW